MEPTPGREMSGMLSIITPIYCSEYVVRLLKDSLRNTDSSEVERIIVHDCPPERKCLQLEGLETEFKSVRVLTSGGANVGKARNLGIAHTRGTWITFWDADDNPNLLEVLEVIDSIADTNAEIAICTYTKKDNRNGNKFHSTPFGRIAILNLLHISNEPALWRMIIKTSIARNASFLDQNLAEDQYYLAQLMSKNPRIAYTNKNIYEYQYNIDNQLTSKKLNSKELRRAIELIKEIPEKSTRIQNKIFIHGICSRLSFTLINCNLRAEKIGPRDILLILRIAINYGLLVAIPIGLIHFKEKVDRRFAKSKN